MVAISVDPPAASAKLAGHLDLGYPLASDESASAIKAFGVYDEENEIAWPAIFVVEKDRTISWRWLADIYKERPPAADIVAAVAALHAATTR